MVQDVVSVNSEEDHRFSYSQPSKRFILYNVLNQPNPQNALNDLNVSNHPNLLNEPNAPNLLSSQSD